MSTNQMTPNEYQEKASRTICPQGESVTTRIDADMSQLLHSIVGIAGEAGELAGAMQKCLWYGQPLDEINIIEELGDVLWYIAEALSALNVPLSQVMEFNIQKLMERYPEKYTDELAVEEGRDREAERKVLEQGYSQHVLRQQDEAGLGPHMTTTKEHLQQMGQGFAEPEEQKEEKPELTASRDDKYGNYIDPNYSSVCKIKGCSNRVHQTNSVGICASCWGAIKHESKNS